MPAVNEPITIPSFDILSNCDCISSAGLNVRLAMNSDTVKPIPPKSATPEIIGQVAWSGMGARRNLTASHENPRIPRNLPITSDMMMASETP